MKTESTKMRLCDFSCYNKAVHTIIWDDEGDDIYICQYHLNKLNNVLDDLTTKQFPFCVFEPGEWIGDEWVEDIRSNS